MTGTRSLTWSEGTGILARKRFYQALLAGSALFTAGVGIKTQTAYDDFEPLSYGPIQEERVSAYVDLVRATAPLRKTGFREVNPEGARRLAQRWVEAKEAGKLKPLTPIAYEDNFDIPAKSQILDAYSSLAIYLNHLARNEADAGQTEQAIKDALLTIELSSILKYSDFQTVGAMAMHQKKALNTMKDSLEQISPSKRQVYRTKLSMVWQNDNQVSLSKMLASQRGHYVDYANRMGLEVPAIHKGFDGESLPEASDPLSLSTVAKTLKLNTMLAKDEELPTFLSMINYAYRNESSCQETAQEVLARS